MNINMILTFFMVLLLTACASEETLNSTSSTDNESALSIASATLVESTTSIVSTESEESVTATQSVTPDNFTLVPLQSVVEEVPPMTGIVLWQTHDIWDGSTTEAETMAEAITLEYRYLRFSDVVNKEKGVYDWTYVDNILDDIASRNHQAILRLYYTYIEDIDPHDEVARATSVPQYIKDLPDYNDNITGNPEGLLTHFPDWSNQELQDFSKEFHTQFAARYNDDQRLAFLQVGFGLWAEYHIYEGIEVELGVNFPSKAFQVEFFNHMDEQYKTLPWSISIDAGDISYSPFDLDPSSLGRSFGLFDDSFMQSEHATDNEVRWDFLDYTERYKIAPLGGELSYLVYPYDQYNVLNPETGAYGISYEEFAEKFHISYMIGNDTTDSHTADRIKEASIASGYQFDIVGLFVSDTRDEVRVVVENTGIAPIYYDAFVAINGIRADDSLRTLYPGEREEYSVLINVENTGIDLTIESDDILDTQQIDFNANLTE